MRVRRLDHNHDWTFGRGRNSYTNKSEAVAQCVKTRLLSLYGDWFLDREQGVKWFNYLTKNPNLMDMEYEIKHTILLTDGVSEIVEFDIIIDENTRRVTVTATIKDIYGGISEVNVNAPDNR